jgi:antitoxin component YwqK of YwqJK toxin-antitoxin module
MPREADLNIAEIPYEWGGMRYRYARVLSEDGSGWVKHGLFVHYAESGNVISEGQFVHGKEHGIWRDFHENGQVAAEGLYKNGEEEGVWRFWDEQGIEEQPVTYDNGKQRA